MSWKIYQNEITAAGLEGDYDQWLGNFSDSPIEWFSQYNVKFSKSYRDLIDKEVVSLPAEIEDLKKKIGSAPGDADSPRIRRVRHGRSRPA